MNNEITKGKHRRMNSRQLHRSKKQGPIMTREQLNEQSLAADHAMDRIQSAVDEASLSKIQRALNRIGTWIFRSSLPK
jgi:hypothetical protein